MDCITIRIINKGSEAHLTVAEKIKINQMFQNNNILCLDILRDAISELVTIHDKKVAEFSDRTRE
jgi:hypothetical protein